jgi:hypothetical protein
MAMDMKTLRVSLEKQLPVGASHDEIVQSLHTIQECRYVIFHFAYKTYDGQERTKSVYLLWAPSAAPLKQRTVYAAFNSHVRTKLEGVSFELQAGDVSDLVHEDVRFFAETGPFLQRFTHTRSFAVRFRSLTSATASSANSTARAFGFFVNNTF